MAACGSLRHIFENTVPENNPSSLIDSLSSSWNQIKPLNPPVDNSFTEIFGELHFKENPNPNPSSPPSTASPIDFVSQTNKITQQDEKWGGLTSFSASGYHRRSDSFSSLNTESLHLCTEGLGSESLGDVEDLKIEFPGSWKNNNNDDNQSHENKNNDDMVEKVQVRGCSSDYYRKRRNTGRVFPPPISCIGKTGKPCVSFRAYRQNGRFILKEIRIPTHERLRACREDGRLRLCFIQPSNQDEDDDDDDVKEDDGGDEERREEKGIVERRDEEEEGQESDEAKVEDDFERGHF